MTTEVAGSIKLPQLVGVTPAQGAQFEKYLSALRNHELGHYGIGKEAASVIDRAILSLPEMPSCRALETAANDLGNRTLNDYREKERQYDVSTGNGKSQGAWLDR